MASERADPALSPAVISFVIAGKTWKLGDPIQSSTGVGAVQKKENGRNFWSEFATAMPVVECILKGRGFGYKISFELDKSIRITDLR
jgi:hypothetical protein